MVFVNRQRYLLVGSMLIATVALTSCVTSDKQRPDLTKITKVKLESRASLLSWYDVTHKSYYGLKGAVKSLVVEPAILVDPGHQAVNDGWKYIFNKDGRLISKEILGESQNVKTTYSYSEKGMLKFVASYQDNKLWRSSSFIYDNGELVKIQFIDKSSEEQVEAKVLKQNVTGGWFEIQQAINSPAVPVYSKFLSDNSLVWSSKGDINNGLGELYYIRTVDGVTSSDVANPGSMNMQEKGGYRYLYKKNGLLKAVESYNAHKNRLFHRTSYQYDELALLRSEQRKIFDSSPFNKVVAESVNYEYLDIDEHGNWLERKLTSKSEFQQQSYLETRKLTYY